MNAPPFANFDPDLGGQWINADEDYGYRLTNKRVIHSWLWRAKMVYDYEPVYDHPMAFIQHDGTMITACAFDDTDQMSSPIFSQGWLPKDGQVGPYFHDCAFRVGGLMFRYPSEQFWKFRQITRAQADALLKQMIRTDPIFRVGPTRAYVVWLGVRARILLEKLGASCLWHEWKVGDDIPTWPYPEKPDCDPAGGYGGGW